jgi:hypothetical protein
MGTIALNRHRGSSAVRSEALGIAARAMALILGALALQGDSGENLSFLRLPSIGMGSGCCSVVTGDFNGDGKADIAVAYGIAGITVLLSNGKGSFTRTDTPLDLGAGVILKGLVASADFNGDHILDLVGITEDPAGPAGFFRSVVLRSRTSTATVSSTCWCIVRGIAAHSPCFSGTGTARSRPQVQSRNSPGGISPGRWLQISTATGSRTLWRRVFVRRTHSMSTYGSGTETAHLPAR